MALVSHSPTIKSTLALIQSYFEQVRDKQNVPYFQHCCNVMMRLGDDVPEYVKFAALLHDLVEDTEATIDDLRAMGYPEETLAIIQLVGAKPTAEEKALEGDAKNMAYFMKIRAIGQSDNVWAMRVKLADLEENTQPHRFTTLDAETQERLGNKYLGMKEYLAACIARCERRFGLVHA